jgi:hypothetical protein
MDRGFAACRSQQVEQYPDGGSLARAIQSKEAENLASVDLEVEPVDRGEFSVALR